MRKLVFRTDPVVKRFRSNGEIPYEVYAKTPSALKIMAALAMVTYRPGEGPKAVLRYGCRIRNPEGGFFDSENCAPVILAAIVRILGRDAISQFLSEHKPADGLSESQWLEEIEQWGALLEREPRKSDLKALLTDLSGCGCYPLSHALAEFCEDSGILS